MQSLTVSIDMCLLWAKNWSMQKPKHAKNYLYCVVKLQMFPTYLYMNAIFVSDLDIRFAQTTLSDHEAYTSLMAL